MEEYIKAIINKHENLFGDFPVIEKINVGFTNTIYSVNDEYIIKICSDSFNEERFLKEIDFYNKNKDNKLIPKLYYSNIEKKEIPYFYEILEKVKGISLFHVWHTFSEEKRKSIIKDISEFMIKMHSKKGEYYDWVEYNKNRFNKLFVEIKERNILKESDQEKLLQAYNKFDKYLESNEVVQIHNDLHFDNILIDNDTIKIIDFERSYYAPRDYELHIIKYMVDRPWKMANEECEKYTKKEDYETIIPYIKEFYPELFNVPNLEKRLSIYLFLYELSHLVRYYPKYYDEIKGTVMNSIDKILN